MAKLRATYDERLIYKTLQRVQVQAVSATAFQ